MVAGTNYKLWVNTSASLNGNDLVLGTSVEAFRPLPVDGKDAPIQILDLDLDW